MKSNITKATLICGTLDISYAMLMAIYKGGSALGILQSVASGPFGPSAREWGLLGSAIGMLVHFFIMLLMVSSYAFVMKYFKALRSIPTIVSGTVYGILLYIIMYWIVLSLRWPTSFPQTDPTQIILALIPHIFLVGIPLAFMMKEPK